MKHDTQIIIGKIIAVLIVVSASISVGIIIGREHLQGPFASNQEIQVESIQEVWNILHQDYIYADKLDDQKLLIGAIRGMVQAADDPHTTFFDKSESDLLRELLQGSFEGIGVRILPEDGFLTIIEPLRGSPAEKAGIRSGDVIVAVDGQSIQDENVDVVVARIKGPKGTQVVLTISREEQQRDITITRDVIDFPTLEYASLEGNIAHIAVFQFLENTASDFDAAVAQALKEGNDKIILDLRSNPGGLLESAVDIADRFLSLNSIILLERTSGGGGEYRTYTAKTPPTLQDIPVVVLQNRASASASEILAGALQDNNSVPIVGETSFGKGTVQIVKPLSGDTSIKYTITEWLTPNEMHIDGVGIAPTVEVEDDPDTEQDEQLDKAIEIIQGL